MPWHGTDTQARKACAQHASTPRQHGTRPTRHAARIASPHPTRHVATRHVRARHAPTRVKCNTTRTNTRPQTQHAPPIWVMMLAPNSNLKFGAQFETRIWALNVGAQFWAQMLAPNLGLKFDPKFGPCPWDGPRPTRANTRPRSGSQC